MSLPGRVLLRSTLHPDGAPLVVALGEWAQFVAEIRAGVFADLA